MHLLYDQCLENSCRSKHPKRGHIQTTFRKTLAQTGLLNAMSMHFPVQWMLFNDDNTWLSNSPPYTLRPERTACTSGQSYESFQVRFSKGSTDNLHSTPHFLEFPFKVQHSRAFLIQNKCLHCSFSHIFLIFNFRIGRCK